MGELDRLMQQARAHEDGVAASRRRSLEREARWQALTREFVSTMQAANVGKLALYRVTQTPIMKPKGFFHRNEQVSTGEFNRTATHVSDGWFIEETSWRSSDREHASRQGLLIAEDNKTYFCSPDIFRNTTPYLPNLAPPYALIKVGLTQSETYSGNPDGPDGLMIGQAALRLVARKQQ